jgi:hypothetical protein
VAPPPLANEGGAMTPEALPLADLAAARLRRPLWRRFVPADCEGVLAWGFVAFAVAFNAWYLWPEVAVPAAKLNDGVLHMMSLRATMTALRAGQDPTDFWFAPVVTGYPLFHHYQHLPFLPTALFAVIFRGVGAVTIFNWTDYLLLCAFPVSIYWSMRRFGFPRIAAALSALLAPLLSTKGLYGFDDLSYVWIGYGLYTQLWAMVLLGPALAQGYTTIRTGRGYLWSVALLAAVLLSHLVLGYIAIVSLLLFALLQPGWGEVLRRGRRLALLLGLAALVTSYMVVPFLRDGAYFNRSVWELQTKYDAFGYEWTLRALVGGRLFDYGRFRSLTLLAGVGALVCAWRWRDERYRIPVVIGGLWLALYFGRPTWGVLLNLLPLSTNMQFHRLIAGVHLGGIMLMGVGLAVPWRWALARKGILYLAVPAAITALLLFPVYQDRRDYLKSNDHFMRASDSANQREQPDIDALEAELRSMPPGRVYAGRAGTWGKNYRVGEVQVSALLNSAGFDMIGYLYHSLSLNAELEGVFDDQRAEQYNLFNIRYVVAPKERAFPPWVQPIKDFGRHRLYRVLTTGYFELVSSDVAFRGDGHGFYPAASNWLTSGLLLSGQYPTLIFAGAAPPGVTPLPLDTAPGVFASQSFSKGRPRGDVLSERVEVNAYSAKVNVLRAGFLMLKETYHPGWHAYIDGREVPTVMLMPSYVAVQLKPGPHNVRFEYRPPRYRWLLLAIGLLALPLIGPAEWGGPRFRARRRRRAAAPTADSAASTSPLLVAPLAAGSAAALAPQPAATPAAARGVASAPPADRVSSSLRARFRSAHHAATSTTAWLLAGLIALATLVRLPLMPLYAYLPGNSLDEYGWKRWIETIHRYGVLNVFRHISNYGTAYYWVLWLMSVAYRWMGNDYRERPVFPGQRYRPLAPPMHLLLKVPPLIFDAALIVAVFAATSALTARRVPRATSRALAFAAAAVIAFHPAVVYEGAVWSQIDDAITAGMIGAVVLAARRRPGWAGAVWVLGFMVKPQPIIIAPVLAVLVLRQTGWRGLARSAVAAVTVSAVVFSPWIIHGEGGRIYDAYRHTDQYAGHFSAATWNLWWFWTVASHPVPHDAMFSGLAFVTFKRVSLVLSLIAVAIALVYTWRRPDLRGTLIACAYMAFAFYVLPTGTAERYLYPFLGLMLPVAIVQRRWLWLYVPASLTFTANVMVVAPPVHIWAGRWVSSPFSLVVSGANVALFVAFTAAMVYGILPRRWRRRRRVPEPVFERRYPLGTLD